MFAHNQRPASGRIGIATALLAALPCGVAPALAQAPSLEAARLAVGETIGVDGVLDEDAWTRAKVATGFVQQEPKLGEPATDDTEVRVLYDESSLYIGIVCSQKGLPTVTTSLARDFKIEDTDSFALVLDPFNDNRNAFIFVVTPYGAIHDEQTTNDGANTNTNWNAVWYTRTARTEDGWTAEIAVPFKTLRFPPADARWGVNFSRRVRSKNEVAFWSFVPRPHGLGRVSLAGSLDGLTSVEPGRNLKVTPYGLFRNTSVKAGADQDFEPGLDVKYSVTSTTTLDLTVNTDFSEVEVDATQVNLTRFPLYFPEKRPFFLESADLFHFGVRPNEKGGGATGEEIIGFFSRRIGLSDERTPIPLWGGARVTGRTGAYSYGFLNVTTREDGEAQRPTTNYTVARGKRNIFGQSDVGAIFMNRQGASGDYTRVAGADLNLQFVDRLNVTSFLAKSFSPGATGRTHSAKILGAWADPRLEILGTWIEIGEEFDPSMSYVPRRDLRMFRGEINVRRRPKIPLIREVHPHITDRYILNADSKLRTKKQHWGLWLYFHDGSRFEIYEQLEFERLDAPFKIHPDFAIPVGDYHFNSWVAQYLHNPTRPLSAGIIYQWGEFWNGTLESIELRGALRVRPRFVLEAKYEHNEVRLVQGAFDTDLASLRVSHGFSTRQFLDLLVQYNSLDDKVGYQLRYNLIHRPLSDLFVVLSEERNTLIGERTRTFTVKFTRLFEF